MPEKPVDSNAKKALEELKFEIANELGLTDAFTRTESKPKTNIFATGRVADIMNRKSRDSDDFDDDFMIGG